MKKDQVDLPNGVVWIPDSKTPNGTAEVPLTPLAVEAFRASNHVQDGLEQDSSARQGSILPHLRPSLHICHAAACWGRSG